VHENKTALGGPHVAGTACADVHKKKRGRGEGRGEKKKRRRTATGNGWPLYVNVVSPLPSSFFFLFQAGRISPDVDSCKLIHILIPVREIRPARKKRRSLPPPAPPATPPLKEHTAAILTSR